MEENNQNIYMIDNENTIIWQVKGKSHYSEVAKKHYPSDISRQRDMFCGFSKNEKGEILAYRFHGEEYQISIETGETTEIGWSK